MMERGDLRLETTNHNVQLQTVAKSSVIWQIQTGSDSACCQITLVFESWCMYCCRTTAVVAWLWGHSFCHQSSAKTTTTTTTSTTTTSSTAICSVLECTVYVAGPLLQWHGYEWSHSVTSVWGSQWRHQSKRRRQGC